MSRSEIRLPSPRLRGAAGGEGVSDRFFSIDLQTLCITEPRKPWIELSVLVHLSNGNGYWCYSRALVSSGGLFAPPKNPATINGPTACRRLAKSRASTQFCLTGLRDTHFLARRSVNIRPGWGGGWNTRSEVRLTGSRRSPVKLPCQIRDFGGVHSNVAA